MLQVVSPPPPGTQLLPETACVACPLRCGGAFRPNSRIEIDFIQNLKVGEVSFKARSDIIREGETATRLYTLLSGWGFRYKTLADGRRQILNFLLPGDLVGLQSKLFDQAMHGVEALTDLTLCCFSRERIWEIFRKFPELAYDVTWLGAQEESLVDENLFSVGRRSAIERVSALLFQLYTRASVLQPDQANAIRLPLTQVQIADALGLSGVHTNRTLQQLRARGLFDLSGGMLRVRDVEGLREVARVAGVSAQKRPLI